MILLGSSLQSLADGTELGIMLVDRHPTPGAETAKLMIAPAKSDEYTTWVNVGSTLAVPSGVLLVTAIRISPEGEPEVSLELAPS